jgi:hypothetical protein
MIKEDKDEIERLVSIKTADYGDKASAQRMVQRYINPGYKACMTCDPAIRQMFKILRGWWEKQNKEAWTFIKTK